MVFGRHDDRWSDHTIYGAVRTDSGWSESGVVPFSGTFNDQGARFYPALDAILFSSDRPTTPGGETTGFNLWIAMHDGQQWMPPEAMVALNSAGNDFHGSAAANGTIYFASDRDGGQGRFDIYRAVLGTMGYEVEALSAVNTGYSEADVFVDPEERYVIFSRTDDPDGFGGDDLWISTRGPESWNEPQNLGSVVNTDEYEYGAYVSRDEKILFFTSHKDGTADIMSVAMSSLQLDWSK